MVEWLEKILDNYLKILSINQFAFVFYRVPG